MCYTLSYDLHLIVFLILLWIVRKWNNLNVFWILNIKFTFKSLVCIPYNVNHFPLLPSCPGQSSVELNTSHPLTTKLCASSMPISLYTAQPFSSQLISGSLEESAESCGKGASSAPRPSPAYLPPVVEWIQFVELAKLAHTQCRRAATLFVSQRYWFFS